MSSWYECHPISRDNPRQWAVNITDSYAGVEPGVYLIKEEKVEECLHDENPFLLNDHEPWEVAKAEDGTNLVYWILDSEAEDYITTRAPGKMQSFFTTPLPKLPLSSGPYHVADLHESRRPTWDEASDITENDCDDIDVLYETGGWVVVDLLLLHEFSEESLQQHADRLLTPGPAATNLADQAKHYRTQILAQIEENERTQS